jgi:ribosomal protein S12 methylthiotransferase
MTKPLPHVAFVHLGCEKNRVDTEHMMGLLDKAGFTLVPSTDSAEFVVVNTCSFIASAREQGVQVLCELEASGKKTIITGCMAQHFREELLKEIPTAMGLVGTGDYGSIVEVLQRAMQGERVAKVSDEPSYVADENVPRIRTSNKSVGWLRVAEGCDCSCAFCIIPQLRGKQRSRSMESILAEAKQMADDGVQEIILVAQNTTNYGVDLYGRAALPELLEKLVNVDVPWIRVHYCYPTGMTPAFLNAMASNPKILPYFDIPLQHTHPDILKAMQRPFQEKHTRGVVAAIREKFPDAAIRSTFIVGFPGEKPQHFEHLLEFIKEGLIDHVGVFTYSDEEGSASYEFKGKVGKGVAEKRRDAIMTAQQTVSRARNAAWVGKEVDVLIEGVSEDDNSIWVGRSARFAPDVDGVVYVRGDARVGKIVRVRITDSDIYDLHGVSTQA